MSYSLGEMRETNITLSPKDLKINEFGPESLQKYAKNVVERLFKVVPQKPKTSSRDLNPDTPTTVEDIFEDHLDAHPFSNSDGISSKSYLLDGPYGTMNGYHGMDISGFQKHNCFRGNVPGGLFKVRMVEDVGMELHRKAKEAEERVLHLSEELEKEAFLLQDSGFSVSALLQIIRNLTEERRNLALEVSAQLQCRIAERASANEALKVAKVDLDSRTQRLEREKSELQSRLEKELDRRSRDWSFKLEKIQSEEQRLREQVRELAEQNVSLQREVSSLNGKDTENRRRITHSELQQKDLMTKVEEARGENQDLQQTPLELQEQFRAAEADQDGVQRSYRRRRRKTRSCRRLLQDYRGPTVNRKRQFMGCDKYLSRKLNGSNHWRSFIIM